MPSPLCSRCPLPLRLCTPPRSWLEAYLQSLECRYNGSIKKESTCDFQWHSRCNASWQCAYASCTIGIPYYIERDERCGALPEAFENNWSRDLIICLPGSRDAPHAESSHGYFNFVQSSITSRSMTGKSSWTVWLATSRLVDQERWATASMLRSSHSWNP